MYIEISRVHIRMVVLLARLSQVGGSLVCETSVQVILSCLTPLTEMRCNCILSYGKVVKRKVHLCGKVVMNEGTSFDSCGEEVDCIDQS